MHNGGKSTAITPRGPAWQVMIGDGLREVVGKEHLKNFKTRNTSKSILTIAECCNALVGCTDSGVGSNVFIVMKDLCNLTGGS